MRRSRRIALAAVAALAIALGLNTVLVNNETRPAKSDIGRILDLPGGDLQVREDGSPKDPPFVLLHGFTASMHWWEPEVPLLGRDHRLIRIDLLGHGDSEKPADGYSMEHQARQVALALDRLKVRQALVVGHSMGGTVGIALAACCRELVRGAVLIDTPPNERYENLPLTAKLGFVPVLGQALRRVLTDDLIRNGLESAFAEGFKVPDQFVRDFRRMTYTAYADSSRESDDYVDARPLDARAAATGVPLMVIFGRQDRLVRPEAARVYRDVPGVRIQMIPGAGHSPIVEKPRETARLILQFARERAGRHREVNR